MTDIAAADSIDSVAALEAIYGEIVPAAKLKVLDHVSEDYGRFIQASPFVVISTAGPEGLDCSPRGDPAGFVRISGDRRTLMIPDRRGNNRVDTLRNIVRDGRIGLLFLIPGIGETMRVNGRARLSRNEALRQSFAMEGKVPACVIVIAVEEIYTQCQKALVRSKLWDQGTQISRADWPTNGQMLAKIASGAFDAATYDATAPERLKQTIY